MNDHPVFDFFRPAVVDVMTILASGREAPTFVTSIGKRANMREPGEQA